jgi:hypothetical protein
MADGKASLIVANEGFASMTDARCSVTGVFSEVENKEDAAACRELYLKRHAEAYWIDFGDFSYIRMDEVVACNFVGGFGRAAAVWLLWLSLSGPMFAKHLENECTGWHAKGKREQDGCGNTWQQFCHCPPATESAIHLIASKVTATSATWCHLRFAMFIQGVCSRCL